MPKINKNYKNIFQTKNYNFKFFQQWVQFGRHVIKEVIDQLLFLKLKKNTNFKQHCKNQ